jgi:hypothetical protein
MVATGWEDMAINAPITDGVIFTGRTVLKATCQILAIHYCAFGTLTDAFNWNRGVETTVAEVVAVAVSTESVKTDIAASLAAVWTIVWAVLASIIVILTIWTALWTDDIFKALTLQTVVTILLTAFHTFDIVNIHWAVIAAIATTVRVQEVGDLNATVVDQVDVAEIPGVVLRRDGDVKLVILWAVAEEVLVVD